MTRHLSFKDIKSTVTPPKGSFHRLSSTRSSPPHVSDEPCCRRIYTTWGTSTLASPASSSSRSSAGRSDPHHCGCRTPRACRARPPCRTPRRTARPRRGQCTRPHSRTRSPCPRLGEAPFTFRWFSGAAVWCVGSNGQMMTIESRGHANQFLLKLTNRSRGRTCCSRSSRPRAAPLDASPSSRSAGSRSAA